MWLHEIKHDGFRVIARKEGARVKLYSRPGNDLTHRFPLIVETLACLRSRVAAAAAPLDRGLQRGMPAALASNGIGPLDLAKETEKLMARFPNARVNADEQRQLRAALYRPLLTIALIEGDRQGSKID